MTRFISWTRRLAGGQWDGGLIAFGLMGLAAGALVALSIIMEGQ